MRSKHGTIPVVLGIAAMLCAAGVHAQTQSAGINQFSCGPLNPPGQFGPFDYRTLTPDIRHKVEDYHFTPSVEAARAGNTGPIGADLDYTLRAFPNSPRALLTVNRYVATKHTSTIVGARYTAECYFERALRFVPDDPMPHLLYAAFLKDRGRKGDAQLQLDEAARLRGDPSNFDFDYNLGLLYFDVGAYDKANEAAKRAYALGAPLPALMNKLKASGRWRE